MSPWRPVRYHGQFGDHSLVGLVLWYVGLQFWPSTLEMLAMFPAPKA